MGNLRFDTWLIQVIGPVYDPQSVFFRTEKIRFMQTESVLQTKNRSRPAKNRFSVALPSTPSEIQCFAFKDPHIFIIWNNPKTTYDFHAYACINWAKPWE